MSMRWIHENQNAPICDEEESDIDDSSDDTDDVVSTITRQDLTEANDDFADDRIVEHSRQKRETIRHPITTISVDEIREKNEIHGYDPNATMGNPVYGPVMQLHSATHFRLVILPSGKVRGDESDDNPYARLRISSVSFGFVQIRGEETGLYLAMNKRGRLYGEENREKDNAIWEHQLLGSYDSYLSRKYKDRLWYLGIKRSGRPKRGGKTALGQKATKFLPIRDKKKNLTSGLVRNSNS